MKTSSQKPTLVHGIGAPSAAPALITRRDFLTILVASSLLAKDVFAQAPEDTRERFRRMSEEAERGDLRSRSKE